jgi:hypothetical protein
MDNKKLPNEVVKRLQALFNNESFIGATLFFYDDAIKITPIRKPPEAVKIPL